MLLQAEKLVQLIESPVFIHLRLQLLNAGSASLPPLLRSLYGLLMLLPQSDAYQLLQQRLNGVMPLHVILQNNTPILSGSLRSIICRELTEEDKRRIKVFTDMQKEEEKE